MSKLNKQIIITTSNKLINESKIKGYLNLDNVKLLYTLDYYLDFSKLYSKYNNYHILIRDFIYSFKNRNKELCVYKPLLTTTSNIITNNIKPEATSLIVVTIPDNQLYQFDIVDFNNVYFDQNSDSLSMIKLYISDINNGVFYYNNVLITSDIELEPNQLLNLQYEPSDTLSNYFIELKYRFKDDNINPLYSILNIIEINVIDSLVIGNQPASVGDISLYPDNRVDTVITLTMLTSQLAPPYNDPEGDALDAIRIDEISTANLGSYFYNGSLIFEGLIIPSADILADLLEHRAADQDAISSDVFNFSVRDSGSLIWVE